MRSKILAFPPLMLALALAIGSTGVANAATISTLADENSSIFWWGLPDTAAYGQTFTMASDAMLNSFSFRINDNGSSIAYASYVFAWDGFNIVGGALFGGGGSTSGSGAMETVTVNTGSTSLTSGQFVVFLQAQSTGAANWGSVTGGDVYGGGAFVFQNNGGNESLFGTVAWSSNWEGPGSDLAFELVYSEQASVPEPTTLALLGLGLVGIGLRRRIKAS